MKINFTKKEYQHLLELVMLGDAMLHGYPGADEGKNPHSELCLKIMSHAREMGHAELVEKIDGVDEPAEDFLDHLHEDYIRRYDETTFWLRLARELSLRDIERFHPEMEDAEDDALDAVAFPYMDKYLKEFAENHLNNLELTKPAQAD